MHRRTAGIVAAWGMFALVGLSACSSAIVKVQQSRDPGFLMDTLTKEKDEWLVEDAARALGRIRHAKAVPALIRIVSDPNAGPYRRSGAAWALGNIGDLQAARPLVSALERASHPEERYAIVEALGRLSSPESRAALESVVNDPDVLVAKAAQKGLLRIDEAK